MNSISGVLKKKISGQGKSKLNCTVFIDGTGLLNYVCLPSSVLYLRVTTNYIEFQEPRKGSFFYSAATAGLFLKRNCEAVLTFEAKGSLGKNYLLQLKSYVKAGLTKRHSGQ